MEKIWYLYTFSKSDVISSDPKHYCALGLGLWSDDRVRVSGNKFSIKRIFDKCSRLKKYITNKLA